jgi:hypothetical protein
MATTEIYQTKVTLQGIKPPIWRRLLVSSDTTLARFHDILQKAMGWTDSHLHMFTINGERYSAPMPYDPGHLLELDAKDSRRVKLSKLVPDEGFKMRYEYDFGDGWDHVIVIEKILPMIPNTKLPVCITGKRTCPPEDVGGIWGYEEFLDAIHDPNHPEHDEYLDWVGGEFDPEAFDKDAVNKRLQILR